MNTEEEQLKQLKDWWNENGLMTVGAVVIAVAVALSWQGWKRQQVVKQAASAAAYQQLVVALEAAIASPGDDIKIAQATHLADQLKADYEGTGFSFFAAFHKARQAVADKDYALAEQELQWVLDQSPEQEIASLAQLRLARVYFEQSQYDDALNLLPQENTSAFAAVYEELRGDILIEQEQYAAAVDAYQSAQQATEANKMEQSPILAAKLQYAESYL